MEDRNLQIMELARALAYAKSEADRAYLRSNAPMVSLPELPEYKTLLSFLILTGGTSEAI